MNLCLYLHLKLCIPFRIWPQPQWPDPQTCCPRAHLPPLRLVPGLGSSITAFGLTNRPCQAPPWFKPGFSQEEKSNKINNAEQPRQQRGVEKQVQRAALWVGIAVRPYFRATWKTQAERALFLPSRASWKRRRKPGKRNWRLTETLLSTLL